MNSKRRLLLAAALLAVTGVRAVSFGTALFAAPPNQTTRVNIPRPIRLREVRGRGLLMSVWLNSTGPFTFALDTGAGTTLISPRVAAAAHLKIKSQSGRSSIAGLSGRGAAVDDATIQTLAAGDRANTFPGPIDAMVTTGLPVDIDGVLDPTQAFSPLGYVIDIPRLELSAFDPQTTPLRADNQPPDGAVVPWLRERQSRRPFVQLDNGDHALIDTGSNLGLAIRDSSAAANHTNASLSRDVGGGQITARRVRPTTVAIGALLLRNIPTDLISGVEADAPVLIGLSALRPFRLAFDPVHRLIEIAPVERARR